MSYKEVSGGICAPRGFAAAGVHCGIRANHNEKYDLALIKAEVRCAAAGVYTTNKVCGAPIKVDRAHLKDGYAQAILVNSGNANTCAANGVALAEECCELVGKALGIAAGFPPETADIRIAQYESGARTPKHALLCALADALGVLPSALDIPHIKSREVLNQLLLALEDEYGLTVTITENNERSICNGK